MLYIAFLIAPSLLFAQQRVQGIVLDATTQQRVAGVYFYNLNTESGKFNNLKGEFSLSADSGDVLVLAKEGYFPDTLHIKDKSTVLVTLQRSSIWLREVHVMGKMSPREAYEQARKENSEAYRRGNTGPLLSSGSTGAGLSINALYSLLSKEGKNARYLQRIIERDYRDALIDYRFTPTLVSSLTQLSGAQLENFMFEYKPSYYFILNSNDYELGIYIKKSFEAYKKNPNLRRTQHLLDPVEE